MAEFRMPSLGADMEAGTLVAWRVVPGQHVQRGDIVAVVETEKSTIDVEVFQTGVIGQLLVEPGTRVPVGTPLATIEQVSATPTPAVDRVRPAPQERAPAGRSEPGPVLAGAVTSPLVRRAARERGLDPLTVPGSGPGGLVTRADVEAAGAAPVGAVRTPDVRDPKAPSQPGRRQGGRRPLVSPRARRRAASLGVDVASLDGTGASGAVTTDDVERAVRTAQRGIDAAAAARPPLASPAPAASSAQDRKAAMRRAIGALMARSKREVPHYYLATRIDLSTALTWLGRTNAERPVPKRILPAALLLKATALAAAEVPALNGFWVDGAFRPADAVHLGVAISLRGGGLIAPAIRDAQSKPLDELMGDLRDLGTRARGGRLRSSEMADPTLTVTNLGEQGAEVVYGVIYPPQVALIGFGRILDQPWAENRMVGVRPVVMATLSADHRASDGHTGGLLLAAIDRHLQRPEEL
jgi:pyruvate dehydrogenase E2 component (dihydrolipoamide acetyltransferase)